MPSKKDIKLINSLKLKKFRQKYNLFVAEGPKIIDSLLQSEKYPIRSVYHTAQYNPEDLSTGKITHELVDERTMKAISFLKNPSSVMVVAEMSASTEFLVNRAIYLDGVQDPGNVGTIIRTADWFGYDAVIRSDDSADFYSTKVIQSTMGAFVNMGLHEMSRTNLLQMEGYQLLAADMDGISVNQIKPSSKVILIMGSEGQGVHPDFHNGEIQKVTIPGAKGRISESLNVSIAAGIIAANLWSKI